MRKILFTACLSLSMGIGTSPGWAVQLPDMGDSSATVVSPHEERQLGEQFMRQVRRSLHLIDDPEVSEYVQNLGTRLTSHLDGSLFPYTFFVVDSGVINAFAAPGGYIGIHSGLILASQSEDELAGVTAHEIAHVSQRHLPRAIEQASKLSVPTTAALIAALVLGRNNSEITEAALATTLAGHQQASINFTRGNEQEADRIGMDLLVRAEFDPRGMPEFFERLQAAYRFYENSLPEFLSTHPVTTSRIADSRARAEQFPAVKERSRTTFPFIQAKLRVLTQPSASDAVDIFRAALGKGSKTDQDVARYGYALALTRSGDTKTAREYTQSLLKTDPERITFILAAANVESAEKKFERAAELLEDGLILFPHHHALTMALGEALINNGDANKARQILRTHVKQRDTDPLVYRLYARAAGESGFQIDAHMALAEQYYLTGETATALQQLKVAKNLVDKRPDKDRLFYESSRIEARIKELKIELAATKR